MIKLTPIYNTQAMELWVNPGDIQRIIVRPDIAKGSPSTEVMLVCVGAEAEFWKVSETPDEIRAAIEEFYISGLKAAVDGPRVIEGLIEEKRCQAECAEHGKKPDFNEFGFPEGLRYCLTPGCGKERTPTGFCPECQADIESRCEFCGNAPGGCRCTVGQENDGGLTAETWLSPWVKLRYTDRGAGMPQWDVLCWNSVKGVWYFVRGHFSTPDMAIHALKEESRAMNESYLGR